MVSGRGVLPVTNWLFGVGYELAGAQVEGWKFGQVSVFGVVSGRCFRLGYFAPLGLGFFCLFSVGDAHRYDIAPRWGWVRNCR